MSSHSPNTRFKRKETFGMQVSDVVVAPASEEPASTQAEVIVERRAEPRRRILKGGNLYFNSGYGAFSCMVKNVTDKGALVLMEDSSGLPSEFDFKINGEVQARRATLGWSEKGKAGIRFL